MYALISELLGKLLGICEGVLVVPEKDRYARLLEGEDVWKWGDLRNSWW